MVMAMNSMKFYSTHAKGRKELKTTIVHGHPDSVVNDLKDLGVFFSAVQPAFRNWPQRSLGILMYPLHTTYQYGPILFSPHKQERG